MFNFFEKTTDAPLAIERGEREGEEDIERERREKEIAPECSKCLGKRHLLKGTYSRCAVLQTIGERHGS